MDSANEQRIAYASLLAGMYAQDRDAWAELHTEFYRRLVGLLCARFRIPAPDAEDIAAETIQAAIGQLQRHSLEDPMALPKYLWVIAKRTAQMWIERKKGLQQLDGLSPLAFAAIDAQHAVLPRPFPEDLLKPVREALLLLSERDRTILQLFYFEEQTKEEIMAHLGLNKTQFRLYKTRAIARISAVIHGIPKFVYRPDGTGEPITQRRIRQIRQERDGLRRPD